MAHPLIFPMTAHVALVALLYVILTIAREPKVWGIGKGMEISSHWARIEPRISANLSNQFEWPVLFYVACLLLVQDRRVGATAVILAWVFIAGRLLHSSIQILTANVRLRGLVFTINFLAVLGLWSLAVR